MFSFLISLIGWLGVCINFSINFIPYYSIKDLIKKNKTLYEVSILVLFFNILKSSAQIGKGLQMAQIEFTVSNIIGLLLSLTWVLIWLFYFAEKKVIPLALYYFLTLDAVVEIFVIFFFLIAVWDVQIVSMITNIIISFLVIPYKNLFTALKSGNYTLIPKNYLAINIINYFLWFIYGFYKNDFSIYVDNLINLFSCCIQYMLYFCIKYKLIEFNNYHKELKEEKNEIKVISSINNNK
jgi:hypothetical protein